MKMHKPPRSQREINRRFSNSGKINCPDKEVKDHIYIVYGNNHR